MKVVANTPTGKPATKHMQLNIINLILIKYIYVIWPTLPQKVAV